MPFTEHNGTRLHWEERGPENGSKSASTILLVMGHRYSSAMWYPAIPELSKTHRVIWFDNQGTGRSGYRKTTSVEEMAGDAFAVMDAAGVAKAHIFGVSMGGVIVLEMARQHRERVLGLIVGCSGILSADKPRMPSWAKIIYYMPPWMLKALTPKKRGDGAYGSAAKPEDIAHDTAVLDKDPYVVAGVLAQAMAIAGYTLSKEEVAGFKVPTLVLHGDEDGTVPFAYGEELAATLPGARFVRIEGAGHNFLVAGKEKTLAALGAFIDEVDAAA